MALLNKTFSTEFSEGKLDRAERFAHARHHHKKAYVAQLEKKDKKKAYAAHLEKKELEDEDWQAMTDTERRRALRAKKQQESRGQRSDRRAGDDRDEVPNRSVAQLEASYRLPAQTTVRQRRGRPANHIPGTQVASVATLSVEQKAKGQLGSSKVVGRTIANRQHLVECDCMPTSPEENVREAALHLRALDSSKCPASEKALASWLHRKGCCALRCDVLVLPSSLAAAMIQLLDKEVSLRRALMPFAGSDAEELELKHVGDAARRAVTCLRKMGNMFTDWPYAEKARWLCSQSYGILRVDPEKLASELSQRVATRDEKGSLMYDEKLLQAVPRPTLSAPWMVEDFEKVNKALVEQTLNVLLEKGDVGLQTMRALKQDGVRKAGRRWKATVLSRFGDEEPVLVDVRPRIRWSEDSYRWMIEIQTKVFESPGCASAADFNRELRQAMEADIAAQFTPEQVKVTGLTFPKSLFIHGGTGIRELQRALQWRLSVDREAGTLVATPNKFGSMTAQDLKKLVMLVCSKEPMYRCPSALTEAEAMTLKNNKAFHARKEWSAHLSIEITPSKNVAGSFDVCGRPDFFAMLDNSRGDWVFKGTEAAVKRFHDAAEHAHEAIADIADEVRRLMREQKGLPGSLPTQQERLEEREVIFEAFKEGKKMVFRSMGEPS